MKTAPQEGPVFLSGQLEAYIAALDQPGEDEPEAIDQEDRERFEEMMRLATSSLEGFAEPFAERLLGLLEQNRETWQWCADDFYSREIVANIRGIVHRFLRLSPVLVGIIPSKEVAMYLREATRSFIYGFFPGSIALCRAALEAGLSEHMKRRLGSDSTLDLMKKIDAAARLHLISNRDAGLGHAVRKTANDVLHRKPVKERLAFDTIVQTRGFLKELYRR